MLYYLEQIVRNMYLCLLTSMITEGVILCNHWLTLKPYLSSRLRFSVDFLSNEKLELRN